MISRLGAKYGPVRLVLWEGAARAASYPDYVLISINLSIAILSRSDRSIKISEA